MNEYQLSNTRCTSRDTLHDMARKYNKNMQNKANLKITRIYVSPCITNAYGNIIAKISPKNKAKQSQFKPNFRQKLASFFQILALNRKEIVAFCHSLHSRHGRVEEDGQARLWRNKKREKIGA